MTKVKIHWEEVQKGTEIKFFSDTEEEEKPPQMLCVFCYGKGRFAKFHLADRNTAEPAFIKMMENRTFSEIELEGWEAKAIELPLDDGQVLVGAIGQQLQDISAMLLAAIFRDKSSDH